MTKEIRVNERDILDMMYSLERDPTNKSYAIREFRKFLLDNPECINQEFKFMYYPQTMLMRAAVSGIVTAVEILIEFKANIEQRSSTEDRTALHYVLEEGGSYKAVIKLLELGADPDALMLYDQKFLHPIQIIFHSYSEANEVAIKLLKEFYKAGANFNHPSIEGVIDDYDLIEAQKTFDKLRDAYNGKCKYEYSESEDSVSNDDYEYRGLDDGSEYSASIDDDYEKELKIENAPVLYPANIESNNIYVLMLEANKEPINKEDFNIKTFLFEGQKMMTHATQGFKAVDFAVDMHNLISEPTVGNSQLVLRDVIHFQSIIQGSNSYLLGLSAIDITSLVSHGKYKQAIGEVIKTAEYMVLPTLAEGELFSALYAAKVMTITGLVTAAKLYIHYSNYGTKISEFNSNIAYGKLFHYCGFENSAKDYIVDALDIAGIHHPLLQHIHTEKILSGEDFLSYYYK